ncbi:hypothetical protein Scep_016540 [Stephania cephalantha]|uniref:Uncharacterized protein n=1 Tax=Stephania cephalantha TaxID=152367 RepID=A0AAP0NSQ3_9MAGN
MALHRLSEGMMILHYVLRPLSHFVAQLQRSFYHHSASLSSLFLFVSSPFSTASFPSSLDHHGFLCALLFPLISISCLCLSFSFSSFLFSMPLMWLQLHLSQAA